MASLNASQMEALMIVERVSTVPSLIGIAFITYTYWLCKAFDKPINRLVYFASLGNLGMNIATLISVNGPLGGQKSALCQLQAFLIQQFLGVDALWVSCMAFNVYLAFFRGFTVPQLRALDKYYLGICYPLAFVPALVYLFVSSEARGMIYGPAIVWCWISIEWEFLRFATLYAVIWIAMLITTCIYIRAFVVIWHKRKNLNGFLNPFNENPFINTITREFIISYEDRTDVIYRDPKSGVETRGYQQYRYLVEGGRPEDNTPAQPTFLQMSALSREVAQNEPNAEAWLMARTAFLFFISVLIIWIPASINRVYAILHPSAVNFPLNFTSALVFPLQGFFNMIVYMITSKTACKNLWMSIRNCVRSKLAFGNRRRGKSPEVQKDIKLDRLQQRRQSRRLDSAVTSVTSLTRTSN